MRKLTIVLVMAVVLGMVLAVSCGGAAPAPTVTVTKTAPPVTVTIGATPGAAPTVTVTQTAPAVTVTASPVTVTVTPTPTPPKLVKLRDAVSTGGAALFFDNVAQERGIAAKRGIEIESKEMTTDAANVAIFIGQADFNPGSVFPFYPERPNLKLVGPHMVAHFSIMVRKDSPYRSYQDLKGKKIGIMGPATGAYELANVSTKLQGLDLEKDFQLIVGTPAVQAGWLLKGEVEAIHTYEPITTKLLLENPDKVREIYWLNDLYRTLTGNYWMVGGIMVTKEWLDKNTDLGRQLGLVFDDTFIYIYGHPEVWKSDFAKKLWKIENEATAELLGKRMPGTVARPPYGPAYKAMLVQQAQVMANVGLRPAGILDWIKGAITFGD